MTRCHLSLALPAVLGLLAILADRWFRSRLKALSPKADLSVKNANGFFQAVLSQYLALDALHWSHVNTLTAVQGATLAGGYALWVAKQPCLAASLVSLGYLLTVGLRLIVERTKQVRDNNNPLLERIGRELNPDWVLNPQWDEVVGYDRPVKVRGDHVVSSVIVLFLISDLALIWFVLERVPAAS